MNVLGCRGAPLLVPAAVFFGCMALATRPAAAALFATVHIPAHGVRVLPLDLAAGVLLGWQRWATDGWSAPALTHVVANLLQVR